MDGITNELAQRIWNDKNPGAKMTMDVNQTAAGFLKKFNLPNAGLSSYTSLTFRQVKLDTYIIW